MNRVIAFDLGGAGAGTVLVEAADDAQPQGQTRVSRGMVAEKAGESFEAAVAGITPIAAAVIAKLREAVADASEFQVEFGVKLSASAGVILAKAATEGHCKVAVKWANKK